MTARKAELEPDNLRLLMRMAAVAPLPPELAPAMNEALKHADAALAEADGATEPGPEPQLPEGEYATVETTPF